MSKCIGCGMETSDNNKLCTRCFKLKNYGEYETVSKDNCEFLSIIDSIDKNSLVLYVTSLFNLNLDYIDKFKNVVLVLTKRDIMPKSIKDEKIIEYIKNRVNVEKIIIISSLKNYNLDNLIDIIRKYKTNDNVYIVGNTNSGKSTLINKLIKNYSMSDIEITTSLYPSTTLDKIEINLEDGLNLIDTPGLIENGSFINDFKLLKKITPKKEIKPRVYQLKENGSILIDKIVRIDYETIDSSAVIYIANGVRVDRISLNNMALKELNYKEFILDNNKDIVIPELCFIKFTNKVKLNIYVEDDIKVYKRDNLI